MESPVKEKDMDIPFEAVKIGIKGDIV